MNPLSAHSLRRATRISVMLCLILALTLTLSPIPPTHADGTRIIQSNDPSVIFIGDWETVQSSQASGGSYLQNTSTNAALQITFDGPGVEIFYVTGPTFDPIAIEIDGMVLRTVLTTNSIVGLGRSTVINYLADTTHRLKVYGPMVGHIAIDAFAVMESPLRPPAVPTRLTVNQLTATESGVSVALSWADNSEDEYGFVVHVIHGTNLNWQQWETLTVTGSDVTSLEISVPYDEIWCVAISSFRHGVGRTAESSLSYPACIFTVGSVFWY